VTLFLIFQRYNRQVEAKFSISLEEKMSVKAYESSSYLQEYLDCEHPILGSKRKAIRCLQDIGYFLTTTALPNAKLIHEERLQLK
jgi:hypothetical protein